MFNPRSIPYLPSKLSERAIIRATLNSLARTRFDRSVGDWNGLLGLYVRTFDLELAISRDLCAVPPGWLENHRVLLPDAFQPVRQDQIAVRLERMLHAPRDPEAIEAILAAASYVTQDTADGTSKRRRYILSVPDLVGKLVRAQALNAGYVDALLRGRLGRCVAAIAKERLGALPQSRAIELLLAMVRMWGLHDLQVIAAKLHQAMDSPTRGLFERKDAAAQPFQAVMKDPAKMAEMAEIATRLLRRKAVDGPQPTIEDQARFWGFVNATGFKALAREVGLEMGFSPEQLDDDKDITFEDLPKIAKVLRRFTGLAKIIGIEIAAEGKRKWDDRAPTDPSKPTAKSVAHSTAAAPRYDAEAPAALAYAIVAFIDLAEQLPVMIKLRLAGEPVADVPNDLGSHVRRGDHRVTFERMFAAYRTVFLRDPNYLRNEIREEMPTETSPAIFASTNALKAARRDFVKGVTATAAHRLGEDDPLTAADGIEPGKPTAYGADSLDKALAILKRDHKEGHYLYNPELTPAIAWRLSN